MKKPKIELKNIKHHAGLSQETHAYTATIYVDGKKWATVENTGQGGCDYVHPLSGYNDQEAVSELDKRIKATYPKLMCKLFPDGLEERLESICCGLVNEYLFTKDWRARLKRRIYAIKDNSIFEWSAKFKPTIEMLAKFKEKQPGYQWLNSMPEKEAFALIREAQGTIE